MARKNPHIGSSFDSWLDEEGIRREVTAAAIKAVKARQLAELKKKKPSRPASSRSRATSICAIARGSEEM
jgi:hypothetical protein